MTLQSSQHRQLVEAFHEIIHGRTTHGTRLVLRLGGVDVSSLFADVLIQQGFQKCRVRDVNLEPGERVPAFLIRDQEAYFGWVFWEKFTEKKMRKLWGSILRNQKGDWSIQISSNSRTPIYANRQMLTEMEIDLVR